MKNSADFQFKKFKISQQKAPFKVGTDAVLLGSWADVKHDKLLLDIGTGTGVIALMLAQRSPNALIHALELNSEAFQEAAQNITNSIFANRVKALYADFNHFQSNLKYNHLVCNPPYFKGSLQNPNSSLSAARHQDSGLTFLQLIKSARKNTDEKGKFSVVIPTLAGDEFIGLALNEGFYLSRKCDVKPNPDKESKRLLLEFKLENSSVFEQSSLVIEIERHKYAPKFQDLTNDFYL